MKTLKAFIFYFHMFQTNIAKTYNIELTDGWYYVQGLVDFEMNALLHKGVVKIGTKLLIYHAELIGAGEGIDPLDVSTRIIKIILVTVKKSEY